MARNRYEALSLKPGFRGKELYVTCTSPQTFEWIKRQINEHSPKCQMVEWGGVPGKTYQFRKLRKERGRAMAETLAWELFETLCHAGWMPLDWEERGSYRLRWVEQVEGGKTWHSKH
jgi:hypothetical protein